MADGADICLIVEGAYPFVAGGVSAWAHALIEAQSHLRFALVAIVPDETSRPTAYQLPGNVISFNVLPLHLPPRPRQPVAGESARALILAALAFQRAGRLEQLRDVLRLLAVHGGRALPADFLDSEEAWFAIERAAREDMPETSFLDYFWSLRSLLTAFLAVMLAPLPDAGVYHAISTGYAGLLAARAHLERGRPALLTEHGIYTNERRIEIASADWLHDRVVAGMTLDTNRRTLKDVWTDCFAAYARAAYAASDHIVTLFAGNREMQIRDGAMPAKCFVIPNGIDCAGYGSLARANASHPPTVALIGRVVPIKDVKTYIRACALLKQRFPDLEALVLGPADEDPAYYAECVNLAREQGLERNLRFTGRVALADYLPRVHVNVLTSLSEAQPLVLLETGAAGVPSVATDVGACREMILGMPNENPPFGDGGAITPIGDAHATAEAVARLLADPALLAAAANAMRARVNHSYSKARMDASYRRLYDALLGRSARLHQTGGLQWRA